MIEGRTVEGPVASALSHWPPSTLRGAWESGLFEGLPRAGGCGRLQSSRREAVWSLPGLAVGLSASGEPGPCSWACGSPWHPRQIAVGGTLSDRRLGTQAQLRDVAAEPDQARSV